MRNLKRALSLALAAAMLISLMVVGASAADYGDEASISHTEAVDVLTGLGVVGGDQNGNFNPTATLTRAEFCVMIANSLTGGNFDQTLFQGTATPFTDVQGHWGASYIAYCYSVGVIAGTSATTFSPDSTLTAAQASAILLMALGYNQANEFAANGQFSLNVTKWAQQAGLYEDLSVSANAGITRDQTAQLIFNALTVATPVNYSTLTGAYSTTGYSSGVLSGVVVRGDDTDTAHFNYTLASKNFNVTKSTANTDDFMRPGVTWVYKGEAIGFGADDATNVAVVNSTGKTVASYVTDVLKQTYTYASSGTVVSVNGAAPVANTYSLKVGSTIEFYMNPTTVNQVDRVVVIEPTVYTLTADAATKVVDNETRVIVPGVSGMGGYVAANTTETVVGYQGLVKDDVVLVYKSVADNDADGDIITYITKADSVSGVVSGMRDGNKVVVNGVAYANSGLANSSNSWSSDYTNTYTFYLDGANNVIKAVKNTDLETGNYAYVLESKWVEGAELGKTNFAQARLLLADGTNIIVTVDKIDGDTTVKESPSAGQEEYNDADNKFVTYKVTSDNKYELTTKTTGNLTAGTLTGDKANFNGSLVGNSSTIFLVNTKSASDPDITVYTGISNVPTINSVTTASKVFVDGGVAKYVYVITASANIQGTDGQYVYIPGTGEDYDRLSYTYIPESSSGKGDDYYQFDAIVNGVAQQVKLDATTSIVDNTGDNTADANVAVNTMYKVMSTDSNGIITLLSNASANVSGTKGVEVTGGTLITAGQSYKVTGTTEAYYIDHTGAVTELNASDIQKDSTDMVYVTKTSDNGNTADRVIVVEQIARTTQITGFTYVIDGAETEVTQTLSNGRTHTVSGLTDGKIVSITDVTCSDEAIWAVSGAATVSDTDDANRDIIITVTAEDGTTTGTITISFSVSG